MGNAIARADFSKTTWLESRRVETGTSFTCQTSCILPLMIIDFVLVQKQEDLNDSKVVILKCLHIYDSIKLLHLVPKGL